MDKEIKNHKQAKQIMIRKLSAIAKDAAITREICKKFYPKASIIASNFNGLADTSINLRDVVRMFPE